MEMEINIEDYLSKDEIKEIVKESVQKHVRDIVGGSKEYTFVQKLAKELAKEGCQSLIPDFEQTISEHLKEEIKSIKLENLFWESFGWKSTGNKLINKLLVEHESLIKTLLSICYGLLIALFVQLTLQSGHGVIGYLLTFNLALYFSIKLLKLHFNPEK